MSVDSTHQLSAKLRTAIDQSAKGPVLFFLTSSLGWLVVALLLGVVASIKAHSPGFLESLGSFNTGRVYVAHLNVLIYGWAFQLAFALLIWLMSRLCRKPVTQPGVISVSGLLWNVAVTVGLLGIFLGQGTGIPWMEFPAACNFLFLFCYLLITVWSFIQFRVRRGGHIYLSQWYLLVALFLFPWIYATSSLFLLAYQGHPVMAAGIAAWYKSALLFLFFIPVAIAAAYYIIPKVTGQPIFSHSLGVFAFWSLLVICPWAGMQKLTGAPLPVWMPYVGAGAAILFFLPAFGVVVNLYTTLRSYAGNAAQSPALRFAYAGLISLAAFGILSVFLYLPSLLQATQFSMTGYGFEILGLLGIFGMSAYSAVYYLVPRLTQREWLFPKLIRWHFWFSSYGVVSIVLCAILGGCLQGLAHEGWNTPWVNAATSAYAFNIFNTIALIFTLFSTLCFGLNLLVMVARLGRQSNRPTLLIEHHAPSVHGPDGKL